jgi:hypothetical protein
MTRSTRVIIAYQPLLTYFKFINFKQSLETQKSEAILVVVASPLKEDHKLNLENQQNKFAKIILLQSSKLHTNMC